MQQATLIVTLATAFMVVTASADERRTVSVNGHGETQVEPDIATVEMGTFVFEADLLKGKQEADAKAETLKLQMSLAKADVKSRIEDRMKRVKSAHHARSAKLSQAWSLTKEALAV